MNTIINLFTRPIFWILKQLFQMPLAQAVSDKVLDDNFGGLYVVLSKAIVVVGLWDKGIRGPVFERAIVDLKTALNAELAKGKTP